MNSETLLIVLFEWQNMIRQRSMNALLLLSAQKFYPVSEGAISEEKELEIRKLGGKKI